jgi:hypothetical protein
VQRKDWQGEVTADKFFEFENIEFASIESAFSFAEDVLDFFIFLI